MHQHGKGKKIGMPRGKKYSSLEPSTRLVIVHSIHAKND